MRIVTTVVLMLLLSVSLCLASAPTDLSTVLDKYQDISLKFEAGMSYIDYSREYQQLYVDTKKLTNNHPEYKDDLEKLLSFYTDVKYLWSIYLDDVDSISSGSKVYQKFNTNYPNLFNSINTYKSTNGSYWKTMDMIHELINQANKESQVIQIKYKL
jgi:hypothetical protein